MTLRPVLPVWLRSFLRYVALRPTGWPALRRAKTGWETDWLNVPRWWSTSASAPPARDHGGADIRPDAAGQAGDRHRLQHGGGGLLHLSAPRRQSAGAVRHRRLVP